MSNDPYTKVDCIFLASTYKAVCVGLPSGNEQWIPRSLLHGGDDKKMPDCDRGDEIVLEVREWFTEKDEWDTPPKEPEQPSHEVGDDEIPF